MTQRYDVNELNELYLNKVIEVQGFINELKGEKVFSLIDISKSKAIHNKIICKCESTRNIQLSNVIVKGKLISVATTKNIILPAAFEVESFEYITEQDIDDIAKEKTNTFYVNENLSSLLFSTAKEMLNYLNTQAKREGFELTHKKALSSHSLTLLCYQHSHYKKSQQLNSGCEFRVSICFSKKLNGYHVTSFHNIHNHDLVPKVFIHKILDPKAIEYIKTLVKASVEIWKIICIIEMTFNVTLSIQQMRCICKGLKKRIKNFETNDLYKYMKDINDLYKYMKDINEKTLFYQTKIGKSIRLQAFATFTNEELKNLAEYGDFIAIDPTFAPLTTDWSIIPLTVINKERKIKSGGIIFASHNKAEIFKWILKLLVLKLPCRDKIKTIYSDDDLALDSAFHMILESDDVINEYDDE